MITIVDYGAGNIGSVTRVLEGLGVQYKVTSDPEDVRAADGIILPGVGSFGYMMEDLKAKGLVEPIKEQAAKGVPLLGICLGMQVLFESSEESPGVPGLGLLPGDVARFRAGKVPHMGWNFVRGYTNGFQGGYAYFANSYYVRPSDNGDILAVTDNLQTFTSAVRRDNITGVQFHPEKSGQWGIDLIRGWVGC